MIKANIERKLKKQKGTRHRTFSEKQGLGEVKEKKLTGTTN